jgi:hypothetical protein
MLSLRGGEGSFEWRVGTGHWRWLILGSLGVVASACWGRTDDATDVTIDPGGTPGGSGTPDVGATPGHITSTPVERCSNPTPLGGGWEKCENGLTHRTEPGQCSSAVPRAEGVDPQWIESLYPDYPAASNAGFPLPQCLRDSDCTERPFGHCDVASTGDGATGIFCSYGCVSDTDCGAGQICLCGDPVGTCMASTCSSDADCKGGALCASFSADPGCPHGEFACQTSRDKCVTTTDCAEAQTCSIDDSSRGARYCAKNIWVCGRPFLVDGAARRADVAERADWYPALQRSAARALAAPLVDDAELRAAVARGWLDQALMEHASVAAFARFSLQLLSLGAPADLLQECARALEDEIGHARDCFALARRHGERDLGPAALPLGGALDGQDLRAIVLGTIAEGCIGESLAALEAAEARAHCTDAPASAVLERIAADETRHAQLAWRFVAWALETGPASLREDVREAFARELSAAAERAPAVASDFDQQLLRHGLMSAGLRAALRQRVLAELITPCAEALLGGGGLPLAGRVAWLSEHTPV